MSVAAQPARQSVAAAPQQTLLDQVIEETTRRYGAGLFAPQNRRELREIAEEWYDSALLPSHCYPPTEDKQTKQRIQYTDKQREWWRKRGIARATVIMMCGAELGLLPGPALRGIYVIEGTAAPAAATLAGVVQKHPLCLDWHILEQTDERCTIRTRRKGRDETILTVEAKQFKSLIEEKNRYGQPKRPTWTLYRSRMLLARCQAWLARAVYPDITGGLYAAEELADRIDAPAIRPHAPDLGGSEENPHLDAIMDMIADTDDGPEPMPPTQPEKPAEPAKPEEQPQNLGASQPTNEQPTPAPRLTEAEIKFIDGAQEAAGMKELTGQTILNRPRWLNIIRQNPASPDRIELMLAEVERRIAAARPQ